ncbi:hypothetical protein K502DRAFT_311313 [Neoconidiobolus thromboides FSU 785]|nr:hypothetical protein K502DRAFT_311313 [Neoconidiobolus thromboides FSU 785]
MLTKFQHEKKANLEKEVKLGGQRNYIQVFCNGLVPSIYSILYIYNYNSTTISNILCLSSANFATFLTFAFIGHYACCCGDTWASELGILNSDWPYLITTFQQVPPGTNGGISLIGTLASLMGGQVMGLVAALSLSYQYPQCGFKLQLIGITTFAGLFGSMLDSLLGATLQATYYDTKKLKVINTKIVDKKDKATQLISGYEVLDNNMVNFISSLITGILSGIIGLCLVSI